MARSASSALVQTRNAAVRMWWRSNNCLENAFEPSSWAPACPGPKVGIPAARMRSASPAHSGASGPTTTRSTPCATATWTWPSRSITLTGTQVATASMPGLPGAATTS
jgi:hypothetical protein